MRRFFRVLFVSSIIARIINHGFLQIALPAVSGAYFLTLDVWGTEWKVIADHKSIHEFAFAVLLCATLFTQLYKGIAVSFFRDAEESYLRFLEGFMILTASVVDFKMRRFRDCAKSLKPQGNTFKAITKPKDQIEYIIDQSVKWLRESFSLGENEISMTVIGLNGDTDTCFYVFDSQRSWNRTKAKQIVNGKSAASYCLEKGEPVFLADKFLAARDERYYISERDQRSKTGSVYCYPVFVNLPNKRLCSNDEDSQKIAASILREICRRIELELTLLSMRAWQFNE